LNDAIDDDNVFERLVMAFLYNDADLKNAALKHVMDDKNGVNRVSILTSRDWTELLAKNLELAKDICKAIISK
jgi:hypothetical protein